MNYEPLSKIIISRVLYRWNTTKIKAFMSISTVKL